MLKDKNIDNKNIVHFNLQNVEASRAIVHFSINNESSKIEYILFFINSCEFSVIPVILLLTGVNCALYYSYDE